MQLTTGIPKLDEALNGGIPAQKSILLCAEPGVENTEFAMQILYHRLQNGDKGLYLTNNKKPDTVRYLLSKYDWNLTDFEKKGVFTFLDCYSGLIAQPSDAKFYVEDPTDLKQIDSVLIKALDKLKNQDTIFVFDALSSFIDIYGPKRELFEYLEHWLRSAYKFNVTPVFIFTEWPYKDSLVKKVKSLFDCVINLKAIEKKVILRKYYSIAKANWLKEIEKKEIPFRILTPGGVKVYIPKILVTGPYNAGKSSFIHSASTRAVSVDRLGTTIALDHGHVDYKGFSVDLWGTPGQERFDPILELLGSESLGVIVVVDSTDPNGFSRAKEMISLSKTEGLPVVVVANKANLNGALTPEEIRQRMNLPKDVPIIPVVAEDLNSVQPGKPAKLKKEDVAKVLDKLFEVII